MHQAMRKRSKVERYITNAEKKYINEVLSQCKLGDMKNRKGKDSAEAVNKEKERRVRPELRQKINMNIPDRGQLRQCIGV